MLELKISTIEKHIGKVYKKQIIDGKEQSIVWWKSKEECLHVRYAMDYEEHYQKMSKIATCKGTLEAQFGKAMEAANLSKTIQMIVVFHILSRGHPMIDYPKYSSLLSYLNVPHYPYSHWSINPGWEWENCLVAVEKEDLKDKVKESNFIALSLDEVIAVDNTSWVCMHLNTV